MLLEQMAAFAGTSLQAKSEFISNNFPNAKVSDGVKRDVFEYNWIANAAFDKMMEKNSFNDALHAWAKTIGKTCGQVREIILALRAVIMFARHSAPMNFQVSVEEVETNGCSAIKED